MRIAARLAIAATAGILVAGAVAAPLLATRAPMLALCLRWFFSSVCHQHPERSFFLFGAPLAVCARCIGIYAGAGLGSLLRTARSTALWFCALALALNCFDVAAETAGLHGNDPWLRLIFGAVLGIAAAALLSSEPGPAPVSSPRETRSALR